MPFKSPTNFTVLQFMQSQIGSNFVWQSKQRKYMSPALDRGELRHAGRRTRTCVDNGPPKYPRLSGTHHCCSHSSSLYHYPASCPTFFNICYGPSPCRSRVQSASPNVKNFTQPTICVSSSSPLLLLPGTQAIWVNVLPLLDYVLALLPEILGVFSATWHLPSGALHHSSFQCHAKRILG